MTHTHRRAPRTRAAALATQHSGRDHHSKHPRGEMKKHGVGQYNWGDPKDWARDQNERDASSPVALDKGDPMWDEDAASVSSQ